MDLKSLIKQLARVPTMLIAPFMGVFMRWKRYLNLRSIIGRLSTVMINTFKKIFRFHPDDIGDYYKVGRYYIFKNLLYLVVLAFCFIPFVYFRWIAKPAAIQTSVVTGKINTFFYKEEELGSYSGVAKIISSNKKLRYEGDVAEGLCTGEGKLYNREGVLVYEGQFLKNKYHGEGREYFGLTGNLRYDGFFKDNIYQGEGVLYFSDGMTKRYEGNFVNGLFDGNGILYDYNGIKMYEGEFKNGLYEGEGKQNFPSTEKILYVGAFSKGLKEGKGSLYHDFGTIIFEGPFRKDEINVAAFLGEPEELVMAAYKTPNTIYTFDAVDDQVLNFEKFTDLFVIDDAKRVTKIVQLETKIPELMQTDYFTGETFADEADLAALNVTGIRKDFKKYSANTQFTQEFYRSEKMFVKTYVLDDVFYSSFAQKQGEEPLYYVIQAKNGRKKG